MSEVDEGTLRGVRFHAPVGVLPHETRFARSRTIDATVSVRRDVAAIGHGRQYDAVVGATAGAIGGLATLANPLSGRDVRDSLER